MNILIHICVVGSVVEIQWTKFKMEDPPGSLVLVAHPPRRMFVQNYGALETWAILRQLGSNRNFILWILLRDHPETAALLFSLHSVLLNAFWSFAWPSPYRTRPECSPDLPACCSAALKPRKVTFIFLKAIKYGTYWLRTSRKSF